MAETINTAVNVSSTTPKLPDGVIGIESITPDVVAGVRVFVHYNGPTDQLSGMCTGMVVLDPGATPHPPHRHPEEEFLIIAEGTAEIECDGKFTDCGPGAIMYCAGNVLHGITNKSKVPMTFYWAKWMAKGV